MGNIIDIKENYILHLDGQLLKILLRDNSSKRNIMWATDNYRLKGDGYQYFDTISVASITGRNGKTIRPRIDKSKKELAKRTKDKAEVFTPSWICNAQNNLIDEAWFGRANVFNEEKEKSWETSHEKVQFTNGKTWQDYIMDRRLEITCGEAPYLVSRYDTVTGETIDVENRIGLLDRKLRIINENIDSEQEWIEWVKKAFQNVYGYDWQGDNVLLARENMLLTFEDYYTKKFEVPPINEYMIEIAKIISWNIWQMDGLKFVIPNSCKKVRPAQMSIFDDEIVDEVCEGCAKNNPFKHNGIYCKIMNWETKRSQKFVSILKRG